jgi:glycosyltransferase involved in cell wall biosynthesis
MTAPMQRIGRASGRRSDPGRVLYVLTSLGLGGAETQTLTLARAMRRHGWQPALVSLADGPLLDQFRAAGVPTRVLGATPGVHDYSVVLKLAQAFRDYRPAVVHSHTAPANLLSRAARLFAPVPRLISNAHNVFEGAGRHRLYRATDWLADLTTNVSQAAVDRYIEIGAAPRGRIRYVPNAIEPARYARDPASGEAIRAELELGDRFVWVAVGRLQPQKNYPRMLAAFRAVRRSFPDDVLLIAGQGELGEPLAADIAAHGDGDAIRLLGRRSDVRALLSAADALVLSSDYEGLPMVLLEAACAHLPVVATRVGGNAEIVVDGETGLITAAELDDLVDGMLRMRRMTAAGRRALGERAAERVKAVYSLDVVTATWDAIYRGEGAGGGARCPRTQSATK